MSVAQPTTYSERRAAGEFERVAEERAQQLAAKENVETTPEPIGPTSHIPLGSWDELYAQMFEWREELIVHEGSGGSVRVPSLDPPWQASNPRVVLTADGVAFGPFADGAALGGSLLYLGLNEQPFSAVRNLAYSMRYSSDDNNLEAGAAPYLRVVTRDADGGAHDAIFTPGSQPYSGLGAGPLQTFVATSGFWRFDDDSGSGGVTLDELLSQYGEQLITRLAITLGFTAGVMLVGLLRSWQINGVTYAFGVETSA